MELFQNVKIRKTKYFRIFKEGSKHFIYHTCLGNPLEVSSSFYDFLRIIDKGLTLRDLKPYEEIHDDTVRLIETGMFEFVNNKVDFLEAGILANKKKIRTGELVKLLVISVTTRCNLGCSYCNVHMTQEKHGIAGKPMEYDIGRTAIDEYISLLKSAGTKEAAISYFGGEPMLNFKLIKKLIEYVEFKKTNEDIPKLVQAISTNGILLNEDSIKFFKKHECQIVVSLDGIKEVNDKKRVFKNGKGSFDFIDKNLRLLAKHDVQTMIVATIEEENAPYLKEFVDYVNSTGIKQLSIKECIYKDTSKAERALVTDKIFEALNYAKTKGIHSQYGPGGLDYTRGCQGLGGLLCVEPNGDVYPCPEGIRIKLGNANQLSQIPLSNEYDHISSRITGNLPDCKGCDVEGICRGGCAGESEFRFDDIYKVNKKVCDDIRENIKRRLAIRACI